MLSLLVTCCTSQLGLHASSPGLPGAGVIEKNEKLLCVQHMEYFSLLRVKGVVLLAVCCSSSVIYCVVKSTTTYFIVFNPPSPFPLNKLFWHQ